MICPECHVETFEIIHVCEAMSAATISTEGARRCSEKQGGVINLAPTPAPSGEAAQEVRDFLTEFFPEVGHDWDRYICLLVDLPSKPGKVPTLIELLTAWGDRSRREERVKVKDLLADIRNIFDYARYDSITIHPAEADLRVKEFDAALTPPAEPKEGKNG